VGRKLLRRTGVLNYLSSGTENSRNWNIIHCILHSASFHFI